MRSQLRSGASFAGISNGDAAGKTWKEVWGSKVWKKNENYVSIFSVLLYSLWYCQSGCFGPPVPLLCIYFRGFKNKWMHELNARIMREMFQFPCKYVWRFSKGPCYLWSSVKYLLDASSWCSLVIDKQTHLRFQEAFFLHSMCWDFLPLSLFPKKAFEGLLFIL